MRFLYHLKHGGQLFEEDGVDHTDEGWFDHPAKAGLVPIVDPNAPTIWVDPASLPAPKLAAVSVKPEEAAQPRQEPVWAPIPENWSELHWKQQCALASQITGGAVETKPAAVAVIEAELQRRAA